VEGQVGAPQRRYPFTTPNANLKVKVASGGTLEPNSGEAGLSDLRIRLALDFLHFVFVALRNSRAPDQTNTPGGSSDRSKPGCGLAPTGEMPAHGWIIEPGAVDDLSHAGSRPLPTQDLS